MPAINVDPDNLDLHGRRFDVHANDVGELGGQLIALMDGPIGLLGDDDFCEGFRQNYLPQLRSLAQGFLDIGGSVADVGTGLHAMARDYRTMSEVAERAV
jgi:hypothetical protein